MKITVSISRRARRLAAFTIVEATVGMGIMGTCVAALFSGFTSGFFTMQLARENQRATQIMLEKSRDIAALQLGSDQHGGFHPPRLAT